jgi:hypothetical protein
VNHQTFDFRFARLTLTSKLSSKPDFAKIILSSTISNAEFDHIFESLFSEFLGIILVHTLQYGEFSIASFK